MFTLYLALISWTMWLSQANVYCDDWIVRTKYEHQRTYLWEHEWYVVLDRGKQYICKRNFNSYEIKNAK